MIHVVLVVPLPRQEHLPGRGRLAGRQIPDLRGREARGAGEEVGEAPRALHAQVEERVLLLVHEVVGDRAQPVAVEAIRALGGILGDVEERLAVGGPGHRHDLLDPIGRKIARPQILDVERVLAEAGDVGRVGQTMAVVAHGDGPEPEIRMPLREEVQVERHLLRRLQAPRLPAEDGILLARLRPRIVEVPAPAVRDGLVVLLDASEHLGVERVLQRLGRLQDRVGVGVLGPEMGQDLGVVLLPEPVIVVLAPVAVDDVDLRDLPGDGRDKHYRRRGSGMLRHGRFRTSLT